MWKRSLFILLLALGASNGLHAQRLGPAAFPSAAPTFAAAPSPPSPAARLFHDESAAALSGRGGTTGALIGLGVGAVAGLVAHEATGGGVCSENEPECRTGFIVVGALSGAVIGAVIGALIGSKNE